MSILYITLDIHDIAVVMSDKLKYHSFSVIVYILTGSVDENTLRCKLSAVFTHTANWGDIAAIGPISI